MPDERKWYYAENKERKGPFDESVFIGMIKSGELPPETLVWTKGFEKWRLLANTELANHLEAEIPPPPDDFEVEAQPQTSSTPSVSPAPPAPPAPSAASPVVKQPGKPMTMKNINRIFAVGIALVVACLFFIGSSDGDKVSSDNKEESISGRTVANTPTQSSPVENDENLPTDVTEDDKTSTVTSEADEKWDTDVTRPSQSKLTAFVLNKLIADGNEDFLDYYSMLIVPSRPDHDPEINLYVNTNVVDFQNEDSIDVLESLMGFVHEYLVENKMNISEIQINGILDFDHETVGWGHYNDGAFDWTANDTTITPVTTTAAAMSDGDFIKLCETGTAQRVQEALKNGANVNAKHDDGSTALMWAAQNNSDPEVTSILLKHGADVNAKRNNGGTALLQATWSTHSPEVITILLQNGADVNASSQGGNTALMHAAAKDNLEAVAILLESGADINARMDTGETAMFFAAEMTDNPEIFSYLLRNGIDASIRDIDGRRAIDFSFKNVNLRNSPVYQELLAASNAGGSGQQHTPVTGKNHQQENPELYAEIEQQKANLGMGFDKQIHLHIAQLYYEAGDYENGFMHTNMCLRSGGGAEEVMALISIVNNDAEKNRLKQLGKRIFPGNVVFDYM